MAASASAGALAFYAPWDPAAGVALQRQADRIDILAPAWISVVGQGDNVQAVDAADANRQIAGLRRRPTLLPVIQNARDGVWQGADAAALLASTARRAALLGHLETDIAAYHGSGVVFDLEDLPARAQSDYLALLREARARFARRHWQVAVSVPVGDSDWDLAAYGRACDLVIVMAYDEHWQTGKPGPIASPAWFAEALKDAVAVVPAGKLVVGLASYGYDWPAGRSATPISVDEARTRAAAAGVVPRRETPASELHFSYVRNGVAHQVWFIDAVASHAQADAAHALGLPNLALWRLGTEDPAIWRWFGAAGA